MEEHNTSKQFLHIVAHPLVILAKVGIHLLMRCASNLFFPFATNLHKTFTRDILYKVLVMLLVFSEKFVGECLHREGDFYVVKFNIAI